MMPQEFGDMGYWHREVPVCPHCQEEDPIAFPSVFPNQFVRTDCVHCEKTYVVRMNLRANYCTEKLPLSEVE